MYRQWHPVKCRITRYRVGEKVADAFVAFADFLSPHKAPVQM